MLPMVRRNGGKMLPMVRKREMLPMVRKREEAD